MFIEFDLEKNGVITVEEMKQIMHDMGYFHIYLI
jgi:Ca2+-binding EF-hand superfamily protein